MAGHFPFSGNGGRASTTAFYEMHAFNDDLQEKYYKWWYDWTKNFVNNDSDLKFAKSFEFNHYPFGQHSHHSFHLNGKYWAVCLSDLGAFIKGNILSKMSSDALHKLEEDHHHALDGFKKEAETNPREKAPDVGYFRHM